MKASVRASVTRSEYIFRLCIAKADGWIVQNLRNETETVYPTELVADEHDRQLGEKLLSVILKTSVQIRRTEFGYVCERR